MVALAERMKRNKVNREESEISRLDSKGTKASGDKKVLNTGNSCLLHQK